MINKTLLTDFVKKANNARQQFCIWKYANNFFVETQENRNSEAKDGLFSDEEAIKNGCKYKNFFGVIIPSLQHSWVLSVARLIDPPFFKKNKGKPNLSIYYLLDLMEDGKIKSDTINKLTQQIEFTKSIKKFRNVFLAHNGIIEGKPLIIKSGVEIFFNNLNNFICSLKSQNSDLADCNDINLDYTEKLSAYGVKEIFEKIT